MTKQSSDLTSSSNDLVRKAAIPTIVAGFLAVVIAGVVKGSHGAIGAAVGAVIVVVFFTIGQVVLGTVIKKNPSMAMSVAMVMYLVKIGVLFVLLLAFKDTKAFDTKVFALTVLLCTLVWTGAEMWAFGTAKVLYVDPGSSPEIVPAVTENDKPFS
jgi:ATP synthase protein I